MNLDKQKENEPYLVRAFEVTDPDITKAEVISEFKGKILAIAGIRGEEYKKSNYPLLVKARNVTIEGLSKIEILEIIE